jgi:hypothetical protein
MEVGEGMGEAGEDSSQWMGAREGGGTIFWIHRGNGSK